MFLSSMVYVSVYLNKKNTRDTGTSVYVHLIGH